MSIVLAVKSLVPENHRKRSHTWDKILWTGHRWSDGAIDLGGNGLPDIVIGSQGAAVVFRYQNSVHDLCC